MDVQKIVPFLWFDDQAEEATEHYTSIFEDSKITDVARYGEAGPGEPGSVMTVTFRLAGQEFIALNGGPDFTFNESISFFVRCETQEEVDDLWKRLTAGGGEPGPCGWLKDRFGVSWQIVPNALLEMMADPNRAKATAVTEAMLKMSKIEIAALRRAYEKAEG
jgi:predicted 3-demethylubiquinone-9 3-methyltransferase (glyoxalase superfamily)